MTNGELRAFSYRCFLRWAPAILSCDGNALEEDAVLKSKSIGAEKDLYDYYIREMILRDKLVRD